jgi:hypothetical protein
MISWAWSPGVLLDKKQPVKLSIATSLRWEAGSGSLISLMWALFTVMRKWIRIWILLILKAMRICDHGLHRPSTSPFWGSITQLWVSKALHGSSLRLYSSIVSVHGPQWLHSETPLPNCECPRPTMAPFWDSTPQLWLSTALILSIYSFWIWLWCLSANSAFDFDVDADLAFHSDANPNPNLASQNYTDAGSQHL